MHEPPDNIGYVCDKHAPRAKPKYYTAKPLEWFVGKCVKLGFPTGKKHPQKEHMWVIVADNAVDMIVSVDGYELYGQLDNDPVYVREYSCGDGVAFNRDEVEDHDPKEGTFTIKKGRKLIAHGNFAGQSASIVKGLEDELHAPFINAIMTYLLGRANLDEKDTLTVIYNGDTYKLTVSLQ